MMYPLDDQIHEHKSVAVVSDDGAIVAAAAADRKVDLPKSNRRRCSNVTPMIVTERNVERLGGEGLHKF